MLHQEPAPSVEASTRSTASSSSSSSPPSSRMEGITGDKVAVVDFGSQVTHLICRRIRELGAYSELISCRNVDEQYLESFAPKAVILSGGPSSVYEEEAPHLKPELWQVLYDKQIPVLGICYGLQEMMWALGGKVSPGSQREFGYAELQVVDRFGKNNPNDHVSAATSLFSDVPTGSQLWMSHGDKVTKMAPGFEVLGSTDNCEYAAIFHEEKNFFGVQFHPEVTHTHCGKQIIKNFLVSSLQNASAYASSAGAASIEKEAKSPTTTIDGSRKPVARNAFSFAKWTMKNFCELEIVKIREQVGPTDYVLGGISGGVDSSVAAGLMHRALGERFRPFLIDTGLLRKDEAQEVQTRLTQHIPGLKLQCVDASAEFYQALHGVTEPERKRKIIGKLFIDAFERAIRESDLPIESTYLLQGTLYPDVIESTSFKGPSSVIKSHHNVGGLPERLKFKGLIEPLRMLFKDEVRSLGRELGLHEDSIMRHPFPGPGLAIRIVGGDVTKERADVLREADNIFISSLKEAGVYNEVGQAFAVLMPECKTVGVMGDARTYEMTVALRAVQSSDFMTADWYPIDWKLLARISNRIINEVRGVNRVCYDCSSKPPATIEWE
ncbi:unnamed protein product [Amoebophrya sp. A120]|nr:unnamed protein product [Amoebophrya sp. A120]|eukprot:GSA120T00022816001.1